MRGCVSMQHSSPGIKYVFPTSWSTEPVQRNVWTGGAVFCPHLLCADLSLAAARPTLSFAVHLFTNPSHHSRTAAGASSRRGCQTYRLPDFFVATRHIQEVVVVRKVLLSLPRGYIKFHRKIDRVGHSLQYLSPYYLSFAVLLIPI